MISWSSSPEGMRILEAKARSGEEEDDDPGSIAIARGAECWREERRASQLTDEGGQSAQRKSGSRRRGLWFLRPGNRQGSRGLNGRLRWL